MWLWSLVPGVSSPVTESMTDIERDGDRPKTPLTHSLSHQLDAGTAIERLASQWFCFCSDSPLWSKIKALFLVCSAFGQKPGREPFPPEESWQLGHCCCCSGFDIKGRMGFCVGSNWCKERNCEVGRHWGRRGIPVRSSDWKREFRKTLSFIHPLFFSSWGGVLPSGVRVKEGSHPGPTNTTFHSATSLYSASAILESQLHVGGVVRNLKRLGVIWHCMLWYYINIVVISGSSSFRFVFPQLMANVAETTECLATSWHSCAQLWLDCNPFLAKHNDATKTRRTLCETGISEFLYQPNNRRVFL